MWRDGGDVLMLSAGVRNSMFFTDAILPDSHRPFPNELWNVHLGTNYMHKFDNGWSGMLGINFGSASDKPFHSINEMNVGFMSFLQIPVWNDRDAWRFSLMYSPVGNLNFPIPGVAYLWNPSDTLHASIGIAVCRHVATGRRPDHQPLLHAADHRERSGNLQGGWQGLHLRRIRVAARGIPLG